MRVFLMIAGLMFLTNISVAQEKMDGLTYMTEMTALAKAVALEEKCNIAIDAEAMMAFVTKRFVGYESKVLAGLNANVTIAQYSLKRASALQMKLLCATTQTYVNKNKLAPTN